MTLLQAHRGVSTDYPENTVSAILGAVHQGYKIVEVDPAVTKDGKIVLLHDRTINRTGRNADGTPFDREIPVGDMTFGQLRELDFGIWFSDQFRGEKIPLLTEILKIAEENHLLVKIDNKFQRFSDQSIARLFAEVSGSGAKAAFTVNSMEFVGQVRRNAPGAEVHYDGLVTEEILQELTAAVPQEQLVVWLPYKTSLNTWVKIPFADEALCALVKKYARLGLWILSDEEQYADAVARFSPDIIETTGALKPRIPERA